ncbi:MAG: RNA methyltransferase [Thermaurantiacus sp.]|uniref:RNA methyltransferase n=1 Tax=Thermaurantiacus sp. TaxID=2820283 RepID=UPI00298EE2B8|nr:RNA methyltransferase [Thermaurantiacus sp.]MDW8415906.1 RNA methyltransferase [Thermaurantiacus sp.]
MEPAIVLVRPQLGQNIGMVARAMANFGLSDLRLVAPRDGWPNPEAGPPAAGADHVLKAARVFASVSEALADCRIVFATAHAQRDLRKPVLSPRAAMAEVRASGVKAGLLFGPERSGLATHDMLTAQGIVTIPAVPGFASLNLAQAVMVLAYEWRLSTPGALDELPRSPERIPATQAELDGLLAQLFAELDAAGYFFPPHRAPATRRTLAGLFAAARFTSEEVRTLRGVFRALSGRRARRPQDATG